MRDTGSAALFPPAASPARADPLDPMNKPSLRARRSLTTLAALTLLATAGPALAQNIQQLAHVDRFPGGTASTNHYAGIWGTVVNGREIAIVPARSGTVFYDCTDPRNPVEVGFIAGPTTGGSGYFWREAQSWGHYVYLSSEHGSFQVVSLANPASPQLVSTFGNSAHSVSIDQDAGILYANGGAGRGIVLYDLNQSATNPPQVGSRRSPYVHDCLPIRGYCYTAQIFDGNFAILDVSNPGNLITISTTTTPRQFPHNIAVDADDRIAIVTEENRGDCFTIYDITNKSAPVVIGTWCSPGGATVHNVFIDGHVAHLACYADGYFTIDISDPTTPVMIGNFDTSAFTGNNYYGDWGCYPFQPSGAVYLSDMQTGFWIVKPDSGVPYRYGAATAGTGAVEPTIDFDGGYAQVGNASFELVAEHTRGGAGCAMLIGFAAGSTPLLGVDILVDLSIAPVAYTATANGATGAAGAGTAGFPLGIPNLASLAGATIFAQGLVFDAAGPAGFAATRGMELAISP